MHDGDSIANRQPMMTRTSALLKKKKKKDKEKPVTKNQLTAA